MNRDLTKGPVLKTMLLFSLPFIAGNLLQQFYNIADTLIVGKFIGSHALAAVGSAYTLMVFLTSILLGLCMGCGALFAIQFGAGKTEELKNSMSVSFLFIGLITLLLNIIVFVWIDPILSFLQVPSELYDLMRNYLHIIFYGIVATFLYNFFACLLRALGNSMIPLLFLAASAILNILLDLYFVLILDLGVEGAALATVIAQYASGLGIVLYTCLHCSWLCIHPVNLRINKAIIREIVQFSSLTCLQQSVMNFGILMIQGLVNSFGPVVMAAFAAAVKIDSFAYMPVQDFGNAFSTFIAQNYGAHKTDRIEIGIRSAVKVSSLFCLVVSSLIFLFAKQLLLLFVQPHEAEILSVGIQYLRVEGSFYWGIGCLFLFYGLYRAIKLPGVSLLLTIISLGTRVLLAYILSPFTGVIGIWTAIPIGWILADLTGFLYYHKKCKNFLYQS